MPEEVLRVSVNEKLDQLLTRLVKQTQDGRIDWQKAGETAPVSYEFNTQSGDRIMIDCRDDDAGAPFDLLVFASDGTKIAELLWSSAASRIETERDSQL